MSESIEISLLGGVTLTGRARPLARRAVGLLAYLVVHADRAHPRSHLASVFWPDSSEAQARTNLRRELHQLRTSLDGCGCLSVSSQTIAWRDVGTCRVDVREFDRARAEALAAERRGDPTTLVRAGQQAVASYEGPLLPGWYDTWVLDARDQLLQQCVDLADRLRVALADAGDLPAATAVARKRLQLAPLDEAGYRAMMSLQAAAADTAGALMTYHRCCSVLEQELGVAPSDALETIHRQIVGLDSPASAPRSTVGPENTLAVGHRLVGRRGEQQRLRDRWSRAVAGHQGLLLISGEAGVGKSRLAAELVAEVARHGAVVASSRCFGASGRLALAPVADWIRTPAISHDLVRLDSVWAEEVARLVPSTATGPVAQDDIPEARAKVDAWQRLRFFEGLARAVLSVGRPTLLVLDDLQWCDNETMLWVVFLLQLTESAPLLVVATAREEELAENAEVLATLRPLRSAGLLDEMSLAPFDAPETAALAEQMLGHPLLEPDLAMLALTTGGYPLSIIEALRAACRQDGTGLAADGMGVVLERRLASVSEPAQELAGLAAAVGRDFGLQLITDASELDAESVVRGVDELWRRRIIRPATAGYAFSHDLLRRAAYDRLPPARRWLHHRRLAEAIERLAGDRLDDVAIELAHHHACSDDPRGAIAWYRRAAGAVARVFAAAEAVRLLRLGLGQLAALPAGAERDLLELDMLQAISAPLNARYGYTSVDLETTLTRLVELSAAAEQPAAQLAGTVGLWASRFVQGDIAGSAALARAALELSGGVPELAGQAHFAVAGSATELGQPALAVRHFDLARELSVGAVSLTVGTRPEVHAQAWAAHARCLLGDLEGAERDCRSSLLRAREVGHPYSLAVALAYAAVTHHLAGDLTSLDEDLVELTDLCARYDFAYYREWGLLLSGWRRGGSDGVETMRTGLRNLSASRSRARLPYWLSLLADAQMRGGDTRRARGTLDAAVVAARQHDDKWWLPELLRQRATLEAPPERARTLRAAAAAAREQGSALLTVRIEDAIAALEPRSAGVPVTSGRANAARTPDA